MPTRRAFFRDIFRDLDEQSGLNAGDRVIVVPESAPPKLLALSSIGQGLIGTASGVRSNSQVTLGSGWTTICTSSALTLTAADVPAKVLVMGSVHGWASSSSDVFSNLWVYCASPSVSNYVMGSTGIWTGTGYSTIISYITGAVSGVYSASAAGTYYVYMVAKTSGTAYAKGGHVTAVAMKS
jgi:hypothetical protein